MDAGVAYRKNVQLQTTFAGILKPSASCDWYVHLMLALQCIFVKLGRVFQLISEELPS
jgi:hypothetical protein